MRDKNEGGEACRVNLTHPPDGGILRGMSTITVAVPDPLDAVMAERMKVVGARSTEEYLLSLVEADCSASEVEELLVQRAAGSFSPLPADWKEQVRTDARKQA